jgi:ABC-type molybdate transport system substrate-binding protein
MVQVVSMFPSQSCLCNIHAAASVVQALQWVAAAYVSEQGLRVQASAEAADGSREDDVFSSSSFLDMQCRQGCA